eukprot:750639-Hanusia_phi.AAC.2
MDSIQEDAVYGEELDVDDEELNEFAKHLGIDPIKEQGLMWICRMALDAPVPEGWSAFEDGDGHTYYFHAETQSSSWDHPSDGYFRQLLSWCRQQQSMATSLTSGSNEAIRMNRELNATIDKLKQKYEELKLAAGKVGAENDALAEKAAWMEAKLKSAEEEHAAEIAGLEEMHARMKEEVSRLRGSEEKCKELNYKLQAAHDALNKAGGGEEISMRDIKVELERQLADERAKSDLLLREKEAWQGRESSLQQQIARTHASNLQDKEEINKLRMMVEELHLEKEQVVRRTQESESLWRMELQESKRAVKAAEERRGAEAEQQKNLEEVLEGVRQELIQVKDEFSMQMKRYQDLQASMASDHAGKRVEHDSQLADKNEQLIQQIHRSEREAVELRDKFAQLELSKVRMQDQLSDMEQVAEREREKSERLMNEVLEVKLQLER